MEPMQQACFPPRRGRRSVSLHAGCTTPPLITSVFPTNMPLGHISLSSRGRRSLWQIDMLSVRVCVCVFSLHSCSHYALNPQIHRQEALWASIWVWDLSFILSFFSFFGFSFLLSGHGGEWASTRQIILHFLFHPLAVFAESLKFNHSFTWRLFVFLNLSVTRVFRTACIASLFSPSPVPLY